MKRRRSRKICLGLALLAVLLPAASEAHDRSYSYSHWSLDQNGARIRLRVRELELTRLGPLAVDSGPFLGRYLANRLELAQADGRACERLDSPVRIEAAEGWRAYEWHVACDSSGARSIRSQILLEVAPSHLHFARIALADGTVLERVLTAGDPSWQLAEGDPAEPGDTASTAGTSVAGYLMLGVQHILSGWDHLAFVLALLLLATSLGEVARLVTGFTVAHSVTLALAVLGLARPDVAAVEAVIGFSVALVAAENVWLLAGRDWRVPAATTVGLLVMAVLAGLGIASLSALTVLGLAIFSASHFALLSRVQHPARVRAALAFVFGLVHGFGFAGLLTEIGLPSERLLPALFGFNLGVELGQLAAVALAWPLLAALGQIGGAREGRRRVASEFGSAAICGLGLFWFVSRAFAQG